MQTRITMNTQQLRAVRLRTLRKNKKLSQWALSDLSGVPRDTIAKIETKGSKNPDPATIASLALHIGSTFEYLMFGAESVDKFSVEARAFAIRVDRLSPERRQKTLEIANAGIDTL